MPATTVLRLVVEEVCVELLFTTTVESDAIALLGLGIAATTVDSDVVELVCELLLAVTTVDKLTTELLVAVA